MTLSVVLMLLLSIFVPVVYAETEEVVSVESSAVETEGNTEGGYSNAIETTNKNLEKKDEIIAEYSEKYGSKTNGTIAYVLYLIQKISIPVCFLGLIWGSLNYFIIGTKKLEKREQGFGMICSFSVGFVVFQIAPLIFALAVAGR